MKEINQNYWACFLTGCLYALSYFFRGSIAPITDVLITEFNATLSQIGLMSSLFWLSYCTLQIPTGILLQYVASEKIIIIAATSFFISSTLFGIIHSNSILLPSIFMLLSGILSAPFILCFISIVTTRFSSNHLAIYGGIMQFVNAIILISGNIFQAFLYQNYRLWRPVYWGISIFTLIAILLFFKIVLAPNSDDIDLADYSEQELDSFYRKKKAELKSTKPLLAENEAEISANSGAVWYKLKRSLMNKWNWLISAHQYCCNTLQLAFNGLYLINYMSLKYNVSRETATLISSTFWITYAFGNVIIGKLSNKYRKRRIFYIITSFIAFLPPVYIVYADADNTPLLVLVACNFLSGLGNGIVTLNFVLSREYNDYYGCSDVASGLLNTLSVTAGFIMNWLIGILMDLHWEQRDGSISNETEDRSYDTSDYNFGFIVIPIIAAAGILLSFLIKETNARPVRWKDKENADETGFTANDSFFQEVQIYFVPF